MHKRCANELFWELYRICHKHYAEDPDGSNGEPRPLKFDGQCAAVQVIASAPMAQEALRSIDLPDDFPRLREQDEPEGEWAVVTLISLCELAHVFDPIEPAAQAPAPTMTLDEMKQALTSAPPRIPDNAYQEQISRRVAVRALGHALWQLWIDLDVELYEMGEQSYRAKRGAQEHQEFIDKHAINLDLN